MDGGGRGQRAGVLRRDWRAGLLRRDASTEPTPGAADDVTGVLDDGR